MNGPGGLADTFPTAAAGGATGFKASAARTTIATCIRLTTRTEWATGFGTILGETTGKTAGGAIPANWSSAA